LGEVETLLAQVWPELAKGYGNHHRGDRRASGRFDPSYDDLSGFGVSATTSRVSAPNGPLHFHPRQQLVQILFPVIPRFHA
jgi:hypothetical protein